MSSLYQRINENLEDGNVNMWTWGFHTNGQAVAVNGTPSSSTTPTSPAAANDCDNDFLHVHVGVNRDPRNETVPDLNCLKDTETETTHIQKTEQGPWNLLKPGSVADGVKWKALMSSFGLQEKDPFDLDKDDIVGCLFATESEAELFFTLYAKMTGFSIRKGHKRSSSDGQIRLREWLCSREGKRMAKHNKRNDRVREAKPITRVGCGVKLRVTLVKNSNKWLAREFISHHSHDLPHDTHKQFLRTNRCVTPAAVRTAMSMRGAGIRTCHIMSYMAELAGGYHRVPFSRHDLDNRIHEYEQVELADGDAAKAIGYLTYKVDNDPGFYAKYSFDDYYRLQTVIWADSQSKRDYICFGHTIAFDTTYKTNDYGKPLLVIVGINHHFRSTILALAILVNETADTYKWIIEAFLECMNGVVPETVMTDGDNAMKAAITELIPTATHRICTWHIANTAPRKVRKPHFVARLNKLMLRYYTEERFEREWQTMVNEFALHNNSWVKSLYNRRHLWAETFVRGPFFGGMTTTQRCESLNSYVKRNLAKPLKLSQFVRLLDQCICRKRQDEAKEDYEDAHTSPLLGQTNMPEIEAQVANTYTRRMFGRVREEIKREGRYLPIWMDKDGDDRLLFKISKYSPTNGEQRYVAIDMKENKFECSCNKFPSEGIPCRHVFAVMKFMDIKRIPDSLLLRRWTKEAKFTTPFPTFSSAKGKGTNMDETSHFGYILARCTEVAYMAAKHDMIWKLTNEELDKMVAIVARAMAEFEGQHIDPGTKEVEPISLRNPLVTKGKGAPRTRNSGVKRPRKCSNCNKIGHNKSTCQRKRGRSDESDSHSPTEISFNEDTVNLDGDEDYAWGMETNEGTSSFLRQQTTKGDSSHNMYNPEIRSCNTHSTPKFVSETIETHSIPTAISPRSAELRNDDCWWPTTSFRT